MLVMQGLCSAMASPGLLDPSLLSRPPSPLASACSVVQGEEAAWMCPAPVGNCFKYQLGAVGWGELQQVLVALGAFPLGVHSAGGGLDQAMALQFLITLLFLQVALAVEWGQGTSDCSCYILVVGRDCTGWGGRREAVLGRHRLGPVLSLGICSFMTWVLVRLELLSTETMGAGG